MSRFEIFRLFRKMALPFLLVTLLATIMALVSFASDPPDFSSSCASGEVITYHRYPKFVPMGKISDGGSIVVRPLGFMSSTAADHGRLYFVNHALFVLDATTGREIAEYPVDRDVNAQTKGYPAVINGLIYLAGAGVLETVDPATGKVIWKYRIAGLGPCTPPVVCGGRIYFGSLAGHVYGLNPYSGKCEKDFKVADVDFGVFDLTRWNDNTLGMLLRSGNWFVEYLTIDADDGKTKFKSPRIHVYMNDEICTSTDVLCIGNSSSTKGISTRTAKRLWEISQQGYCTPYVLNGTLYLAGKPGLRAIDPVSGTFKWNNSVPFGDQQMICAPGSVIGCSRNLITVADEKTGALRWSYNRIKGEITEPAFADGKIFVPSTGGSLFAMDMRTGKRLWTWDSPIVETIDYPRAR
jgi:outer membrane protein assembly factor BamB